MEEIANLRADLDEVKAYAKAKEDEQKGLGFQVIVLEQDQRLKEPLFQVGAATRVRYLEMAKKLVMGSPRSKLDSACIERGNAAAHDAMGEVDASLFYVGTLSPEEKKSIEGSFACLYRTIPGDHGFLSKKISRVIDCEATIRTINVINEGNRPIIQRQQALDQIQILYNKYEKLPRKDFDANEDINSRLARLIALTGEIVEENWKSRPMMQKNGSQCKDSPY